VTPMVLAMLLAVPIGNTAIGMRLSIRRRATLPTVPSPPATATRSQGFFSAFFHFLSLDAKYLYLFPALRIIRRICSPEGCLSSPGSGLCITVTFTGSLLGRDLLGGRRPVLGLQDFIKTLLKTETGVVFIHSFDVVIVRLHPPALYGVSQLQLQKVFQFRL